jgi:replicative DNA helicase
MADDAPKMTKDNKVTSEIESPLLKYLNEFLSDIESQLDSNNLSTGIYTGFDNLDKIMGGLKPGELTVVAGITGQGKSIFVNNIIEYAAIKLKLPVALISIASNPNHILQSFLSSIGHIDANKFRDLTLADEDWLRLTSVIELIKDAPIFISTPPRLSLTHLINEIIELKSSGKELKLLVIDNIRLLDHFHGASYQPAKYEEILRDLKIISAELQISIIVVHTIDNQYPDSRTDKRPVLSDFKPHTSFIIYPDNIIFIYRDEYYNADSPSKGIVELLLAKHKHGPVGIVKLACLLNYHRFENYLEEMPYSEKDDK